MAEEQIQLRPPARHAAIIMDGNGRWAQARGLQRNEGHRAGVDNVRRILRAAGDLGLDYLTLYAFSSENWNRPRLEVNALMRLLEHFLKNHAKDLHEQKVRLRTIGRVDELPSSVTKLIHKTVEETAHYDRWTLVIALNYGSRTEVVDAARAYAEAIREGRVNPAKTTWEDFAQFLYTSDIPDPDIIIRTSGECRISNFLMLQGAYAELYFEPKCWPDFDGEDLARALDHYRRRERRFGRTTEQLRAAPIESPVKS